MSLQKIIRIVILGILLAGCRDAPQLPAKAADKVVIDLALPQAILVQLASTKGFFSEEGVDVTLRLQTSGKAALHGVLTGHANLATVSETPIVFARLAGKPLAIIATVGTSGKNLAVVARKDHAILRPLDLQGKKVGVTLGSNSEFFLDTIFIANGIGRERSTIVHLEPEAMFPALLSGQIDAVATWEPQIIHLQKELGDRGVTFYSEELYTESCNLVASPAYVTQHPETVQKLLRALLKAEEFARKNPAAAQRILAESSGVDNLLVKAIWDNFDRRVTLQQSLVIALEDQARWAMQREPAEAVKIHDYQADIYPAGLLAVKPGAVRLIR